MAIPDYALLLSELQKLCLCSTVEDEDTRHNVADALRKASLSIESPLEVIRRISHGVSSQLQHVDHIANHGPRVVANSTCGCKNWSRFEHI